MYMYNDDDEYNDDDDDDMEYILPMFRSNSAVCWLFWGKKSTNTNNELINADIVLADGDFIDPSLSKNPIYLMIYCIRKAGQAE